MVAVVGGHVENHTGLRAGLRLKRKVSRIHKIDLLDSTHYLDLPTIELELARLVLYQSRFCLSHRWFNYERGRFRSERYNNAAPMKVGGFLVLAHLHYSQS